jgi:hypothetical protein
VTLSEWQPIEELWRATVPGITGHNILVDPDSRSVYVSDGWGVPFPSLKLHRLSLSGGDEQVSTGTRSQGVGALATADKRLWASTDRRLFALDPYSLDVLDQWDKRLIPYTQSIVPTAGRLVMANWHASTVGLFDPQDGSTRRIKVGAQPVIVPDGDQVRLIAGFDGGMATLGPEGELIDKSPTPPLTSAVAMPGGTVWAVLAGQAEGGQGEPPVWERSGTNQVVRLGPDQLVLGMAAKCLGLVADRARSLLWCIEPAGLELVDAARGQVVGRYGTPGGRVQQVSPEAGMAFAVHPAPPQARERSADRIASRLPPWPAGP